MITVSILDKSREEALSRFVASNNDCGPYHTLAWRDTISATYGYKPIYLIASEDGVIVGLLPLFEVLSLTGVPRYISIPFSHCVPIISATKEATDALIKFARQEFGDRKIQIRADLDQSAREFEELVTNFVTTLDLNNDEEKLWKGLNKSSIQRSIKKAQKSGLIVQEKNDLDAYLAFYELQAVTRKKQGSPMYSKKLFTGLYENLAMRGLATCYLAKDGDKVVAGLIVMHKGEFTIYAYGASVNDQISMSKRPNHLLMWHAILEAKKTGAKQFDFGSTPKAHETLLRYKNSWGGQTKELTYSYLNYRSEDMIDREGKVVKIASHVFSKLPIFVNKLIGPFVLKLLG